MGTTGALSESTRHRAPYPAKSDRGGQLGDSKADPTSGEGKKKSWQDKGLGLERRGDILLKRCFQKTISGEGGKKAATVKTQSWGPVGNQEGVGKRETALFSERAPGYMLKKSGERWFSVRAMG